MVNTYSVAFFSLPASMAELHFVTKPIILVEYFQIATRKVVCAITTSDRWTPHFYPFFKIPFFHLTITETTV